MAIEQTPATASQYEDHLRALTEREWTLDDVPYYVPGQPTDFADVAAMDYQDIYPEVWGRRWPGADRTLDVHVATLRTKLGRPGMVATVRGVGYRIAGGTRSGQGSTPIGELDPGHGA